VVVVVTFAATAAGCDLPVIEPALENPYQNYDYWYKGQTHTHTTSSDGHFSLAEVAVLYAQAGYDFIAITDHNSVGTQDPGTLLILQGCESGDWWENHMVAIGVTTCPEECASCAWGVGHPNCSIGENQKRVNQALAQGGLVILAHPSARGKDCFPGGPIEQGWSLHKMRDVHGYHAIEIVTGASTSFDEWEYILGLGRRVWGIASDDFHKGDLGRAWIVVNSNSDEIDRQDIIANIKRGNFYSVRRVSDKVIDVPAFESIGVLGGAVAVSGRGARFVRFFDGSGRVLKTHRCSGDEFSASYIPDDSGDYPMPEVYLRIEIENYAGNVAYSQPLFVID
jgi:hypothetical protein